MHDFEYKLLTNLIKKKYCLFFIIITLLGLYARHMNLFFMSIDSEWILLWFNEISENGKIFALKNNIGDYSITFQFLLALLSYIPLNKIVVYKYFLYIIDIILSFEAGRFVYCLSKDRFKAFLTYSVFFLCPLFISNSSVWGQVDNIYVLFVMISLKKVVEKKYNSAFIFFGIAFSFKMQAIFFLPFLVILYFSERKFSFKLFLLAFLTFYLCNIPGFIFGRSLLEPLTNYLRQSGEFERLSLNIFNLWYVFNGGYLEFFFIALAAALLVLGGVLLYLCREKPVDLSDNYLELSAWCMWTCAMFLPAMHERYTILAETILLIICIYKHKFLYVTLVQFLCSFQTYTYFLYQKEIIFEDLGILVLFAYLYFSKCVFCDIRKSIDSNSEIIKETF